MLFFLIVLQVSRQPDLHSFLRSRVVSQPYLVMERAHAIDGNDWRGYIAGRIMGFIPAWQAVWAAVSTVRVRFS